MSEYKVVNPATGEVEREFATATDAEVQDALARSARGVRRVAHDRQGRARQDAAPRSRPVRRAHRRAGRDDHPRDGQATARGQGEIQLVASIYRYYADHGPDAARGRAAEPGAGRQRAGPQGAGRPAARDHAVELPVLPGGPVRRARTSWSATRSCSSTPRSAPSRRSRWSRSSRRRPAAGRLRQIFATNEQVGRHHRRPARGRRLGHGQRARRLGRRRGRRAAPQEGRPRARRVRPLHRARRRRPRRRGQVRRARPDGQRRPGLQRRPSG